ncbi:CAZyme family GH47 [Penicillium alfredii]|uniref:alpha-1,2-Mannosidase n=1 Tax=Penicillium alfredii TaxID=1506179 RepID=A0A9W9EMG9_9EURO|nr:CAZyme family GH47 [Penicillium alfredii]KAJ5084371.1 CAZyme family GH47 [Penicillium alfredii]
MPAQAPESNPSPGPSSQDGQNAPSSTLPELELLSRPADLSHKVAKFFDNERTLPMYKDKPHFAPRRSPPKRRWRRLLNVLGLCALVLLWYYRSTFPSLKSLGSNDRGVELWKWSNKLDNGDPSVDPTDWDAKREKVRDAFIVSWEGYAESAWGFDKYRPMSNNNKNLVTGGLGWIIVDSLDTLMIMNLTSQVRRARQWITTSLQYNQDQEVSVFETTIRMMGGLLSAHYLSTKYPDLAPVSDDDAGAAGEDLYIEKATDLADRLMGAFETKSGIPLSSVNLNKSTGIYSHADGGATSTSEAASVQIEWKYLAKLTGEAEYWRIAEKVIEVIDGEKAQDGLVPINIHPDTGKFRRNNIRLGSRGDSYYEYLIKQYLQTSEQEPVYKEIWDEALHGVRKHLIAFTKQAQLMIIGERPSGLVKKLTPKMDHLVCFMPGTIALGATGGRPLSEARKSPDWSQQREDEMLMSRELMKTCWAMYRTTETGLAPEITYFKLDPVPKMMADVYPEPSTSGPPQELRGISQPLSPQPDGSEPWRQDIEIRPNDRHNLQRPETVESLLYMYRITGDEIYRQWGWEMFKSFIKHTAVLEQVTSLSTSGKTYRIKGFTSLGNANAVPPDKRDNMESFWMAETLKYFYLLFSDRDFISLEEHVFNTEAHPLPRFKPGGDLRTGWKRQPRN